MAGSSCPIRCTIILLLLSVPSCSSSKLNIPRLLLPYYSAVASNFTLEVNNGCFTWRTTRPEIASVTPFDVADPASCSQRAVVTATSRVPSRKTAVIIAQDTVTGEQLRCDVIVDQIKTVDIETTTHELYLDDSPEEFVIRAMNEEGDVFTSLDGLKFQWFLLKDSKAQVQPEHSVLRIMKFSESSYVTPPHIAVLENQNERGDRILVRGVHTGSAKVVVRLTDPAYQNVKEVSVRIIVIANLQLNPPIVYLLQFTTVSYTVELLKQGRAHKIPMPSNQYYLQVENDVIVSLDTATSTIRAKEMGDTEIRLKDKHINVAGAFREPTGAIYVVNPGYLEFSVLPGRIWVLETDRIYEIFIEIYDKESHRVFAADNLRVEAYFPKEYFHVIESSINGTYHIVKTLQRGLTDIDGKLRAVIREDNTEYIYEPPIRNSQPVEIYDPIQVLPPRLVLPWDPLGHVTYNYQLNATGGSGNYTWSSSNDSVATVNTGGQIITGSLVGETTVTAADAKNAAHWDDMQTFVLPPDSIEFLPSRVEAEIGTSLELPLALYAKLGRDEVIAIHDCRSTPFDVRIRENAIFSLKQETVKPVKGACTVIKVKAEREGHTEVTVSYAYKGVHLTAAVTIAGYKPLRPIDPEHIAIVTPATSKELLFEGGPLPWVHDPLKFERTAIAEIPKLVSMTTVYSYHKSLHSFHVHCLELGEQELTLTVGNRPSSRNKFPASSTATVRFSCADPKGLRIIPLVKRPDGLPPCPISPEQDDKVPAQNYLNLDLQVVVTDGQGRHFDNVSSLEFVWSLSDQSLASFVDTSSSYVTEVVELHNYARRARMLKAIDPHEKVGLLTVEASIKRYKREYFPETSTDLALAAVIKASRIISLVDDAEMKPDRLTLYNHHSLKGQLMVTKGSGHFHLDQGETSLAKVEYTDRTKHVQITPKEEGSFTVTAYDLCLVVEVPAQTTVFISDVHRILLMVVDKVELTKEIQARVQVVDHNNNFIPAEHFPLLNLTPETGADIISIKSSPRTKKSDPFTAYYIVKGVALGRTQLQFVASQTSHQLVHSQPKEIQVFPPLRLEPRNITLIIGALFQVTAHGGPQPESTIDFSLDNVTVGQVSSSGVIEALELGSSTLHGRAVGMDPHSGMVVYSQDSVTVNVVLLEGIRIYAPLKRLQTNTQMPVYVMGLGENETPFTFGSSVPPLLFEWSISSHQVATLNSLFYESGIEPGPENNFAKRLFTKEAGHVTVHVTVTPSSGIFKQVADIAKMSDDVQIQVFEKLQLIKPKLCDGSIIITTNTDAALKTNRDGSSALVTYTVVDADTLPRGQAVVSVTETGHLVSGSTSGQASLLITAHEDFGINQSVVVLVKVKPISYMMLNAKTVIQTSGPSLAAVPLGTPLQFTVSFHDDVGHQFYATNSKVKYRPNRYDLLQMSHGPSNDSLVAKATNIGQTVLKVWDSNNPAVADYVNIVVGYAVHPVQHSVTLGDIVCYHTPLVSTAASTSKWHSSNPVTQIDGESGIALANQVGTSVISYDISDTTSTSTEVTVMPVAKVTLHSNQMQQVSNVASKSHVNVVRLTLQDEFGTATSALHGANCSEVVKSRGYKVWQLPVQCQASLSHPHPLVSVDDLLQVVAEFDQESGQYQCRIARSSSHNQLQILSTLHTDVILKAIVPERDSQPRVTSNSLTLPFVPAFFVHTSELQLSNVIPSANLRVSGTVRVLDGLKVVSTDETIIQVQSHHFDPKEPHIALYPITLHDTSTLWDRNQLEASLEIRSSVTGQSQVVSVRIKLIGQKPKYVMDPVASWSQLFTVLASNYHNIIFAVLCVIATISCLVIAYHAVVGSRQQAANSQSNVFLSPGQSPSQSPLNRSGSGTPGSPYGPYSSYSSPRLWSVDQYPYDNSAVFKRSPLQRSPDK